MCINTIIPVQDITDPTLLEPLVGFHSDAIRYLQLHHASTIPEHSIPHSIRIGEHATTALRNPELRRRHAVALLSHIFSLPIRELLAISHNLVFVHADDLANAPEGWSDEIIAQAVNKGAQFALAPIFKLLPGVTERGIRRILCPDLNSRPIHSPQIDDVLVGDALLHPACPPEFRRRLLDGAFGFSEAFLRQYSVDSEILAAAWKHKGEEFSDVILHHRNVSNEIALQILQRHFSATKSLQTTSLPYCAARPSIALAYMDFWLTHLEDSSSARKESDVLPHILSLLMHMASHPESSKNDPWLGLALSCGLQQLVAHMEVSETGARLLDHLHRLVEIARPFLDQNVVVTYLSNSSNLLRERMALLLAHVAVDPGLIERELPRWRAWAKETVERESRSRSPCLST